MTLWQRFVQGMTAFSLNTVISVAAGLIQARLVFLYLSPADYGQLNVYLSFFATGSVFLGLGLGRVFTSEVARARGTGDHSLARFLITRYSLLGFVAGMLLLFVFVGIGIWLGDVVMWAILGAYLLFSALSNITYVLLHSTTHYRRVAAQSIARNLSRLGLLATMPWWWRGDPITGVALTYPLMELSAVVASLGLSWSTWQRLKAVPVGDFSGADLTGILTQRGIYASLSVPAMRIIDQLPVWFLTIMVGDVAVGAYSAARAAYLLLFSFFNSVEMTLFPLVSEQAPTHPDRLRVVLGQARKYSLWLGLLVASLVTVTAPWLVRIIAGDEHLAAVPLLQLLVWGLVVHALAQSQRPILYAIGEQRVQFAAYLLSMALEAGMLYVAISWLGVEGAVWAILASNLAVVAVRQAVIHRIAPGLSELPGNLFAIEASDRELWQDLRESFGTRRGR